jgi:hypothetical protein
MANEYLALSGAGGVGVKRQEHDLDISVGNFSAGAALTIAAGNDVVIVVRKTGTKGNVLNQLDNAVARFKRYLATRTGTAG